MSPLPPTVPERRRRASGRGGVCHVSPRRSTHPSTARHVPGTGAVRLAHAPWLAADWRGGQRHSPSAHYPSDPTEGELARRPHIPSGSRRGDDATWCHVPTENTFCATGFGGNLRELRAKHPGGPGDDRGVTLPGEPPNRDSGLLPAAHERSDRPVPAAPSRGHPVHLPGAVEGSPCPPPGSQSRGFPGLDSCPSQGRPRGHPVRAAFPPHAGPSNHCGGVTPSGRRPRCRPSPPKTAEGSPRPGAPRTSGQGRCRVEGEPCPWPPEDVRTGGARIDRRGETLPSRLPGPEPTPLQSPAEKPEPRRGVTNLAEEGLRSAARNNKATRLLTRPSRTTQSYAKDLSLRTVKLQYAGSDPGLPPGAGRRPAEVRGQGPIRIRLRCVGGDHPFLAWILT